MVKNTRNLPPDKTGRGRPLNEDRPLVDEGVRLVEAFTQVSAQEVRQALIALAEALARAERRAKNKSLAQR